MKHCKECHEYAFASRRCNEEGEDFTLIEIDCPICGNQDDFYVWGEIWDDELEREINEYYESTY